MKERNRTGYQLSIVVAFTFLMFLSSIFLVERTGMHLVGAVVLASGTNATLTLYDDGDSIKTATTIVPYIEVNNLFKARNIYFYANYTNGTGQSMVGVSGASCSIEFEAGAGGSTGPFSMIENSSLSIWEYNRSIANDGTFSWNVTCQNPSGGTQTLRAYDSVRIFSSGCLDPTAVFPNQISSNTILCGGVETLTPAAGQSVISFSNNNLTLDCNSTIFRGANAEVGINIGPYNGTIIKNCIFENYSKAINNTGNSIDSLLIFNNSFFNLTTNSINVSNIQNITVRSNNFTNNSGSAIAIVNITNATIMRNYFCNNGAPTIIATNANYSATNNTLCINLVSPANNTDQYDINFTFIAPSVGYERTCHLMINNVNASGFVTINGTDEAAKNVTLNNSIYSSQDRFTWRVNCTDGNDNTGLSVLYNTTYRACTVPTVGMSVGSADIMLCPGTYMLNTTGYAITMTYKTSGLLCNNTILRGANSGNIMDVTASAEESQVQHCIFEDFNTGIILIQAGADGFKIINNTFKNIRTDTIRIRRVNTVNITNNSFMSLRTGVLLNNSQDTTIANNSFVNLTYGAYLYNATGTQILNNNFTNITFGALLFDPIIPLQSATSFNNTITNNYFCGIHASALSLLDYSVTQTINNFATTNTFCNSSNSNPNTRIAIVQWTVDALVLNNTDVISGSSVGADSTNPDRTIDVELTNNTGVARLTLIEFNISVDSLYINVNPYRIIANWTNYSKTISSTINFSRTNALGNMLLLNVSDPDIDSIVPSDTRQGITREMKMAARTGVRAVQPAVQQQEADDEDDQEEEPEPVVVKKITYTYAVVLKKIMFNDETLFEDNVIYNSLVMKDYEAYELLFVIENTGTGNITDIFYSLELPESITIVSNTIDKEILESGESAIIAFTLHSADITEAFDIVFNMYSSANSEIDISATLKVILDKEKGTLYSTRQKIIEETRSIITKTYEILFLLFLIPLLLLLRATTIADEKALRRMIDDKKVTEYWRIYVPEETYLKYNEFQNLKPILLEESDIAKANHLAVETKMPYQLATAVVFAEQCLIPKVFTFEEISPEIRHRYPRILFTSPLRNYREDQLKRYIEKQQEKGFTNNEIRESVLQAKWNKEIIKKYLPPEDDLKTFIAEQQKKGFTLGEIRKELLDVKWDKIIVDKAIPRKAVLKEYIAVQRKSGKTNAQIKAALAKVGWEKELLDAYLNAENDLKAYIIFQQHRGFTNGQIQKELMHKGWKKEIILKYFKQQKPYYRK